jgi:O-antigen/teichoic acid export membrane protein
MKTNSILIQSAFAGFTKVVAAFAAFFMTAAVTRTLGAAESGLFLLAVSILAFLSVFFRLGLDNVVLRLISASQGSSKAIGALSTGLITSLAIGLLATLLFFFNVEFIASQVFSKAIFSTVLSVMIWALPFMLVFTLLSSGFQAYYRITAVTWFQSLGLSSLFLTMCTIAYVLYGNVIFNVQYAAWFYVLSAILTCIWALIAWHRQIKGNWGRLNFNDKHLWNSASNLWAASTMSLAVQWSGVLIAGAFVSSADIAFLSAAQRTAMLTSFVLMVVNMVVAPRYARLWQENKISEIQHLAKWSTRGMLILAAPIVAVMVFLPEFIMGLFGDEFKVAGKLLAIMAIGQFINVATGSVGYLLNMSGHEKDYRRVTFFAGPLTVILCFILINQYGVLGAAIATAVGLSIQNLGALYMVKQRLGFWPLG